jgi:hypothetical protein
MTQDLDLMLLPTADWGASLQPVLDDMSDRPINVHSLVKRPFYGPLSDRVSGTGGRMFRA